MHRMGVYLGLVEDEDYEDADGYGPAEPMPARDEYSEPRYSRDGRSAAPARENGREHQREHTRDHSRDQARNYPREHSADWRSEYREVEPVRSPAYPEEQVVQPTYQITALHPRTYNEARTIGEQFRKNTPVIMNLSDMDDADAKRLVDFAAGLTFGLHGRIERVTAKVFLLSPHNVTVTAQDKARIENGFFNQS
jgi:cell division inhibitor SepF